MSLSSSGDTSATSCMGIARKKSTMECISSLRAKRAKQIVTLCKYVELAIIMVTGSCWQNLSAERYERCRFCRFIGKELDRNVALILLGHLHEFYTSED